MNISSKNFSSKELACKHCGVNQVDPFALEKLQLIRDIYGKPLVLTSAYRCELHPIEKAKAKPGKHYEGIAFDISAKTSNEKFELVRIAMEVGATGIGIHKDFVHIDFRESTSVMWLY